MGRPHRHAGLTVSYQTALDRAGILAACEQAAAASQVALLRVRLEEAKSNEMIFSRQSSLGLECMVFAVRCTDGAAGRTTLSTHISSYKTSQSRLFYVIPFGPKFMKGLKPYQRFMKNMPAALGTVPTPTDGRATPAVAAPAALGGGVAMRSGPMEIPPSTLPQSMRRPMRCVTAECSEKHVATLSRVCPECMDMTLYAPAT